MLIPRPVNGSQSVGTRVRRWPEFGWIGQPILIFLGTRLATLTLGYASAILVPRNASQTAPNWYADHLYFWEAWLRWDTIQALNLAQTGYWFDRITGQASPTFSPAYPFLVHLSIAMGLDALSSALLISNLAFLLALVLLYRLLLLKGNGRIAGLAALMICVFPYSFVYSAGYPHSVALLLLISTFYLIELKHDSLAALVGGVAVLATPAGLALWPALIAKRISRSPDKRGRLFSIIGGLSLAIIPVTVMGLIAYFRALSLPDWVISAIILGSRGPNFLDGRGLSTVPAAWLEATASNDGSALLLVFEVLLAIGIVATTPVVTRHLGADYAIFQISLLFLGILAAPTSLGLVLVLSFPAFVALALIFANPMVETLALTGSAFCLALMIARFTNWYGITGWPETAPQYSSSVASVISVWHARVPATLAPGMDVPRGLDLTLDQNILLLGMGQVPRRVEPGGVIHVPLDMYVLHETDQGYLVSVRLVDGAGNQQTLIDRSIWGAADQTLFDSGQSPAFQSRQYLRDDLELRIEKSIPTGVYRVELATFRMPSLSHLPLLTLTGQQVDRVPLGSLIVADADSFGTVDSIQPSRPSGAVFGDSLVLLGNDLTEAAGPPGEELRVTLYWGARSEITHDYTVTVQALDETGRLVAQSDSYPCQGRFPTSALRPGDALRDVHGLRLPLTARGMRLKIIVGVYDLETMARLPVSQPGSASSAAEAVIDPSYSPQGDPSAVGPTRD